MVRAEREDSSCSQSLCSGFSEKFAVRKIISWTISMTARLNLEPVFSYCLRQSYPHFNHLRHPSPGKCDSFGLKRDSDASGFKPR